MNLILGGLQIAIGLVSGSAALMADGAHSLTDLFADAIALLVSAHSHKEADMEHPYGHRRFENAAGMALGGLVLAAGAGMLFSAVSRLSAPSSALADSGLGWVALGIAAVSIGAKEALFRAMLLSAQQAQSSMLVANAWHARSDALSSLAALAGIAGSMLGFPICDPLAAFAVGALVSKMGWSFFWPALQDLMDRGVDEQELNAIRATLEQTPGVMGSHALRTRKMGDYTLVDAHLEVNGALSVAQGHEIAVLARQRALARHRLLDVMIHVDPVEICELRSGPGEAAPPLAGERSQAPRS